MASADVKIEYLDEDPSTDPGSVSLTDYLADQAISMETMLRDYEFVDADASNGFIIMADKTKAFSGERGSKALATIASRQTQDISELGSASPSPWTSMMRQEWVPELRGRQGLQTFYRMKRQDGVVRGSLRASKTALLAAHWYIKPGENTDQDRKIAKFVYDNLFCDLNTTFFSVLNDILLSEEYGFMAFEKVWNPPTLEAGKFVQKLKKIAPRHPIDIEEFLYDKEGGPNAILMESSIDSPTSVPVTIPISKLVIISPEAEAGDLNGISILRSAYKHWFYKDTLYKIDGIQKERHGIGIPVIKLPIGWSKDDKKLADELGRNLRTNERAHVVLPPNWELLFAKVEGQMVDCMKSIDHHDMAIMANVLSAWIKEPTAKSDSLDMSMKATRYVAAVIVDVFNRWVVRELVDKNFKLGPDREYPKLVCRRVGEQEDMRTNSFTIRNFVGAGVIEPDDPMEEALREELDLPPKDMATARKMITDPQSLNPDPNVDANGNPLDPQKAPNGNPNDPNNQNPHHARADNLRTRQPGAGAGASRQQPTPPSGSGAKNSGTDRSGGGHSTRSRG